MKYILFLPFVSLLVSCSSSVNPSEGGFFGGVRGIQTGAYEKQIETRKNKISQLTASSRSLNKESRMLDAKLAQYRGVEQNEIKRIDSLNIKVNILKNEIRYLSRNQNGNQNKINRTKYKLRTIKSEVYQLSEKQKRLSSQNSSTNKTLNKKIEKLKRELDQLSM